MYLSIIILPLAGSVISGFFGRKTGTQGSQILTCLSVITTTILSIISFLEIGMNNNPVSLHLFKWLDSELFNIIWNFQFDSLTVSMLIPVLVISSLVHLYSIGYMSHDPHNQRFFSYLSLFTFMMIILVTGNNYLLMFVGWEGVGVCSYLLVSFWFTRIAANQSSISAFLTNRVGDCFLTIGMIILLWSLGNLDYSIVFSLSSYINKDIITIIGLSLLIGAMAKSSQVGLHIWLPMAMEGPTPVSALIHAATMVTAGVYLLIRSSPLIEYSSTVLLICLWLGAITTIFSSLIGLFQQDIKKIIAYSTMSQLGMMVIGIGLSSYNLALFHLINHAFYKGLLFLGAGAVIHAVADNQDLRKYGGLISSLPLSYTVMLAASLSLVAFPYMTGYYSKDFILESAYSIYNFSGINVYIVAVVGAIFTTLYSIKVLHWTFLGKPNGSWNSYKNVHEGNIFISLPLVILAIFSIYFGFLVKDIFIGLGSGFFADNSIFIHSSHEIVINTEFAVPTIFKIMPFIFTIIFTLLSIVNYESTSNYFYYVKIFNTGYYLFGFFNQRFLIEFFYNYFIVNRVLKVGGQTTKSLDKGIVEKVGPSGFFSILLKISKIISSLSQGIVTYYALYILICVCVYLSIFAIFIPLLDGINSVLAIFITFIIIQDFAIFRMNQRRSHIDSIQLESNMIKFNIKNNKKLKKIYIWGVYTFFKLFLKFIIINLIGFEIFPENSHLDSEDNDDSTEEKAEKSKEDKGKGKATEVSSNADDDEKPSGSHHPMDIDSDPKGKGKEILFSSNFTKYREPNLYDSDSEDEWIENNYTIRPSDSENQASSSKSSIPRQMHHGPWPSDFGGASSSKNASSFSNVASTSDSQNPSSSSGGNTGPTNSEFPQRSKVTRFSAKNMSDFFAQLRISANRIDDQWRDDDSEEENKKKAQEQSKVQEQNEIKKQSEVEEQNEIKKQSETQEQNEIKKQSETQEQLDEDHRASNADIMEESRLQIQANQESSTTEKRSREEEPSSSSSENPTSDDKNSSADEDDSKKNAYKDLLSKKRKR